MSLEARPRRNGAPMAEEESVFGRWSRRKRAVEREEAAEPAAIKVETAQVEAPEEETEEELLARLELPVPESLKEGDDFSGFMRAGVPEFLRRRALRVLWRTNPVLANIDGLNDYDEDFRAPELTQKVLATSYKVGRGIAREVLGADEAEAEESEQATETRTEDQEIALQKTSEQENKVSEREFMGEISEPEPAETEEHQRPRRMKFDT